jgi:hypothetical protein
MANRDIHRLLSTITFLSGITTSCLALGWSDWAVKSFSGNERKYELI